MIVYKMNELMKCPHCSFEYEDRIGLFVSHKFAIGYVPTLWECSQCKKKFVVIRQNGYYDVSIIDESFYVLEGERLIEKSFDGKILMDIKINRDNK